MQWVVSKSIKKFVYNLVTLMEDDDWLMDRINLKEELKGIEPSSLTFAGLCITILPQFH